MIIYYKLVKIIINILNFAKIIINIIIYYYSFLNLNIINKNLFLFQSSGYYYAIFLILNNNFLFFFIYKEITKLRKKIV